MKEITRPVDNLGRIVIPKEFRDENDIKPKDRLCVRVTKEGLLLFRPKSTCAICDMEDDLISVNGNFLCRKCIRTFSAVLATESKWGGTFK